MVTLFLHDDGIFRWFMNNISLTVLFFTNEPKYIFFT